MDPVRVICVDTSVWVEALRDTDGEVARHLAQLLEADLVVLPAPVRIEVLSGASRRDFARLSEGFAGVPGLVPGPGAWQRLEGWVKDAVIAGQRFGVMDLLIAAMAMEHEAPVWSLHADFNRMEKLGFVARYTPRPTASSLPIFAQ